MALGAGPIAHTLSLGSKAAEMLSSTLLIDEGAKASDRDTMLGEVRSRLQAIGTIGGGLSSRKGLIDGYVDTYLGKDFFSSPYEQNQKLIRLRQTAERSILDETNTIHDTSAPLDVRRQSGEAAKAWQRVIEVLPSYDELLANDTKIKAGTSGAPSLSSAAGNLIEGGKKALTTIKNEASTIQKDNTTPSINLDSMTPEQLLKVDPKTLTNPVDKRKLLFKLGALKKSRNGTNPVSR